MQTDDVLLVFTEPEQRGAAERRIRAVHRSGRLATLGGRHRHLDPAFLRHRPDALQHVHSALCDEVPRTYLLRQVLTAALTANAVRPVPGYRAGIPSMAAGWLTGEHRPAPARADRRRRRPRERCTHGPAAPGSGSRPAAPSASARSSPSRPPPSVTWTRPWWRRWVRTTSTGYARTTPTSTCPRRSPNWRWPFRVRDDEVEVTKDVTYDGRHGRRGCSTSTGAATPT